MGAEVIILANPYTYNFLKGLTHSALVHWTLESKNLLPSFFCLISKSQSGKQAISLLLVSPLPLLNLNINT